MRRALAPLAALLLSLAGCDAGNRAAPGSDNAFAGPRVRIVAPHEGQTVVPAPAEGPVTALFELEGGTQGRGAGSTLRYRLDRLDAKGQLAKEGTWTSVPDPAQALSLGTLEAGAYLLTAQALTREGQPWTQEQAGGEGGPRTVHAEATATRRFSVHAEWRKP